MTQAYPLTWPQAQPRTKRRVASQFRTEIDRAVFNVRKGMEAFGRDSGKPVSNLVISSNVTLMDDRPRDGGVAIYFQWDGLDCCIAVDRYQKPKENLQAIVHVIAAERTKLRHGGLNVVRSAFRGYAALPPPPNRKPWWDVLDVPMDCRLDVARDAHRVLAVKHHPDAGGDAETMAEINHAWDEAQRVLA